MSETKHTRGPWFVVPGTLGNIEAQNGTAVGQAFQTKPALLVDHTERMANAHLMSAAPELLEALEMVLDQMGALSNHAELENLLGVEAARGVYAAIAKAEGKRGDVAATVPTEAR